MLSQFNLDKLLARQKRIKLDVAHTIWGQFVKWAYFIFQSQRHIVFGKLGNYGYKIEQKSGKKIPFLFINDKFLKQNCLVCKFPSFVLKPLVKINLQAILKHLDNAIDQEDVRYVVEGTITTIEETLLSSQMPEVKIDLDVMGIFMKNKNQIWFEYVLPTVPTLKEKLRQTSLRFHIEKQEKKIGVSKLALVAKEGFLPKIEANTRIISSKRNLLEQEKKKQTIQQSEERPPSQERQLSRERSEQNSQRSLRKGNSLTKLAKIENSNEHQQSNRDFGRTTRINSFNKPENGGNSQMIGWEMMGAGSDPLKKNQDFARLTNNLKTLMQTKFQFPKDSIQRSLPIIDVFARTLACPIATQRQNPLVAARVGSNLSPKSQSLFITKEGIKYMVANKDTLGKRKQRRKVIILSESEEYRLRMKFELTNAEKQIISTKQQNYKRYLKLFNMIDEKNVYEISLQTLKSILSQINSKYEANQSNSKYDFKDIITDNIEQIKDGYIEAIKKSIIDYILLQDIEMDRLNIFLRHRAPPFYGQIRPKYQQFDQDSLFKQSKPQLEEKLLKNSQNTLKIQAAWIDRYEANSFLSLPDKLDNYMVIDQFWDRQKSNIKKLKQSLINQWIPFLSNIYKQQIAELNRNQIKSNIFFESTATQLHLQARNYMLRQMEAYYDFICKFDKKEINPPDTVVFLEKTKNYYEDCFLSVRLSHRKDQIYFMYSLDQIETKLVDIVDMILKFSSEIPRPQNLITTTKKLYQMGVPQQYDDAYQRIRKEVKRIARMNINNTKKSLEIFNKYTFLLNEMKVIEQWIYKGNHDRRQYSLTFAKYRELYTQVKQQVPCFIRMNMIYVDSSQLKRYLLKCIDDIIARLEKSVYDLVMKRNDEIHSQLSKMIAVATTAAYNCDKLVQIQTSVDSYRRTGIKRLQDKETDLVKWIGITLYSTFYPMSDEDLQAIFETSQFLKEIYIKLDVADNKIFQFRKKLEQQAKDDSRYFNEKLHKLVRDVESLKEYGSIIMKDAAIQVLTSCRNKITQFKAELKDLNRRQQLLSIDETDGQKLIEWDKNLKPFQELWTLVKSYTTMNVSWTRESIFKQDSDFISTQTKLMFKNIIGLSNNQTIKKLAPLSVKIAEDLGDEIKNFQKYIPVIAVFSNPGLKPRHFSQISRAIHYQGDTLSASSNLFLNKVVGLGAADHIEELQVISETATKEYMIETTIQKINKQWQNTRFQMKKYKETFINILTGSSIEQVQALVDDHSLKVLTMKGSVYAKTFERQIEQLENWLNYTNQMMDYAIKVQSVWMYLEPVMTSPDILKHLSVEGSKFRVVDDMWKDITATFTKLSLVKEIAQNKKIVPNLKICHANLQIVQKGLNSYLESKRMSFPRFFFLSNEQLLQILSETKDPTKVQPHLKKCFQGISRLEFEDNRFICGMYSSQDEYVAFGHKINTALARGNVDEWLIQVQQKMKNGVQRQIKDSVSDYSRLPRKDCLLNRCAMSILTVQMTNWTHKIEQSIVENELKQCVVTTQKQLKQIVQLIKSSELKPIYILTLESLIVLSVHNLDVTKNLQSLAINSISDFAWQSQLRYYYAYSTDVHDNVTSVKILNAIVSFNYEYLGNTSRLVITPLTDRCYRTLCSAIFLNYGGAPEGPAGTGKTETVKDLAKALACQCVVFNCSDGLDYKAMGKFFKGLAASGAWSCFDEFNRINLQVLSVVAQQILCIQAAKAKKQNRLFFEDVELQLMENANCFITMNPGYAGRSELPDNLKALFRSVAMMIPDYAMIAEISLYSYGFEQARSLARKIVTTYKLCSQQLSSQEHYDYGMRAVKSVLVAAGNLKRKNQTLEQSSLILKAINDVNVAKFLAFDIPLFAGITSDLFPNIKSPEINYDFLIEEITNEYQTLNLTLNQYILDKIIQIYDMILVRHGLMIVGYPFSGKSTAIDILARSISKCKQKMNENEVEICRINPKSITQKQLYGYFDEVSHEWFDGVLAVKFRQYATTTTSSRKWLLLDGPVDAVWIENMNTVLDDNKKLCLNSGEIISMSKSMSLIFEPMDLLAASPATVSRCGMIYLEPSSVGHQIIINSWLKRNEWIPEDILKILNENFILIDQLYTHFKTFKTICFVSIFSLLTGFFKLLGSQLEILKRYKQNFPEQYVAIQQKYKVTMVTGMFIYSVVWSFGLSVDTPSRKIFDQTFKKIIVGDITSTKKKKNVSFPEKQTLFDYLFRINEEKFSYEWVRWIDMIEENYPKSIQIHEIIVKTGDIVRYNHFLQFGIKQNIPTILVGPTGTGKTTLVKDFYSLKVDHKQYAFLEIVFSSRTTCTQVQEQVQGKLDKRGSKHVIGPKGIPKVIIFVDDLNMPVKEKYGAQPPIQFLRQLIDQEGFYDFKQKEKIFKHTIDIAYLYSMAAINNDITPRFLRHLNVISVTNFDEDTLTRIFTTIFMISFHNHSEQKQIPTLLKYCIELYNQCLKKLLPTPSKVHYIFNLRDLWKFVMGICRADKHKIHSQNIGRLWGHEAKRIFMDRLLPGEKHIVIDMINSMGKRWGKNTEGVYFSDILSVSERSYEQITDLQKVHLSVTTSLNNYNLVSDKPMDLVLFEYALKHILIILRIIRQPKTSALLVGIGGSGRKSFAQLSSFIADYSTMTLQITKNYNYQQFREDIKKIFREIGVKNKSISFLFSDTQIKDEQFLQDINNILNVGTVPNIFSSQQKIQICEAVRKDAAQNLGGEVSMEMIFNYFLQRIRDQLKLIICFSPIGQAFRVRLRMFPSLVNCTTIDWFQQWPKEGLISVANKFLNKTELRYRQAYIELFQHLHSSSKNWSEKLKIELNRYFYVTPTSYIEFIITFKQLLSEKRKENKQLIYKYENGYSKIVSTEEIVEKMKKTLEAMKPQLKKAAQQTSLKMELVKIQKQEADIIMSQISGQERIVLEAVNEANSIKQECEVELALALPKLKAAQNALLVLDKNSLTELRAMLNPPIAVKLTLQGLCLLIDPTPKEKMKNEKTLKMQTDWWAASVRNLANPKLLNDLVNFNKQGLTEVVINNLGKFLNDPNNKDVLSVQNVANSSLACECIIQWVNGIYNFYFVNKKVKPKKESLKLAEEKVNSLNSKLDQKRAELDQANSKVKSLRQELMEAQNNKERLERQYSQCQISLKRASIIITNLKDEKVRWFELSEEYKKQEETLDVSIFIASAQISYLGPFTQAFRQRILEEWCEKFNKTALKIYDVSQVSLVKILGNPIKIREWNMNGLPYDNFSIQNGIIMSNSRRWPLMIDPQSQCNRWLKKQQLARKLKVIKMTDDNFIRNLQNCIQFGTPVLIQNLGTEISAALTPVLLKQTYRKGATTYLKMGQNVLIYSNDFYLYMTTKLRNPHYLPQICTQVVMINFMITEQGLTDQLLALLVSKERPDLQSEKEKLVVESSQNKKVLKQIEDEILNILSNSQNILSDQKAINVLSASKQKSIQINQKQKLAEETEILIDKARRQYLSMAEEGSLLFFAVSDLANIDSMYQYSLSYFTDLFKMAIDNSERNENVQNRLINLRDYFRLSLFKNISRSLFQKDRLLLAALITLRLQKLKGEVLRFLLSTTTSASKMTLQKPKDKWITDKIWGEICKLSEISPFEDILQDFNNKQKKMFEQITTKPNPFSKPIPAKYEIQNFISKLMLYKCLRPQKMIEGFNLLVQHYLGVQFTRSLPFDLSKIYPDSSPQTPLLFILSPGTDPFVSVSNFSKAKQIILESVSLGQGQGVIAEKLIKVNMEVGGWVVLQNCHLSTSWMPNLQKIVQDMDNSDVEIHSDFRLWLTSYPSESFPQTVLQKSLKMTNEPAKGLKNNLYVSFLIDPVCNQEFYESCIHSKPFKKLIYSLCFFHALIQERRKYGALGWNISYEFTQSDLRISCRQLKIYIDNMNDQIPFDALKYLIAECNYGGRVTDQNDRRCLLTLLEHFCNENVVNDDNFSFGNTNEYILPKQLQVYEDYLKYIQKLPTFGSPELVGLHPNADITKDINESNSLLDTLLTCNSESSTAKGQGKSADEEVVDIIKIIINQATFPSEFDEEACLTKYPVKYEESMNTVLNQELGRYNRLLKQIKGTSEQLLKAIKGQLVMTIHLQKMFKALYDGKVPQLWLAKSYPTLKSLSNYIVDLQKRCKFFKEWVAGGIPTTFWLSGFFFTQSFLTGVLQNYSRKFKIPVDELSFQFLFKTSEISTAKSGANIYGLFIEGAGWDAKNECLKQSQDRELFSVCPNIYFKPQKTTSIKKSAYYETPLYKTQLRQGVLSTTGHSTNFVMMINTPSRDDPSHWIKRGVAFLTQIA